MVESVDWYPKDQATERLMFANVDAKIDGYKAKYPVLTEDYVKEIRVMCQSFIIAYDKIGYNRATMKQLTQWFENLMKGEPQGDPAPPAPVFQTISLPTGAFIGIEKSFREFAGLLKKQLNYDRADGLDLMIEREKTDGLNLADAMPDLKLSVLGEPVKVEWKKTGFDALELQYRKQGANLWQLADKSTVSPFEFTPPLSAAGVPEKIEFRAIYLIKNERVGQWSPTYTVTIG